MDRLLDRVRELHLKMGFKENGGEDILFRLALIAEEVGEIAACVTKDRPGIAEEHADLLILVLGNCIALGIEDRIEELVDRKLDKLLTMRPTANGTHARIVTSDNA